MGRAIRVVVVLLVVVALSSVVPAAAQIEHGSFQRIWTRTDLPVATMQVSRTWMWGPGAISPLLAEPYRESPHGTRLVQYFDKSRMEITHPDAVDDGLWYVTNGRLAYELITGQMQVGDDSYELHPAAFVNVAGDPGDPDAPTYASLMRLLAEPAGERSRPIIDTIAGDGVAGTDRHLAQWGVSDEQWVPETGHWIARPFWEFMNAIGLVVEDNVYAPGALFPNPFYATGYPITEAYWTRVRVGGTQQDVLVQCFERRCLTYTPMNDSGWQVEAGNIGRHYYEWRYVQLQQVPVEAVISSGDVQVTNVLANPAVEPGAMHEYVEITNFDAVSIQLEGWRLTDVAGITYTFPDFKLAPGATVRLHVAVGADTTTDLYWGRSASIWNNNGDTASLFDAGGALVSVFSY